MRVIAMDMDGTLLNSKKRISPRTREALLRAERAGVILILASGRPTSGLMEFARELEMEKHHGLLVSYNGSQVVDCATGKVLFNQALSVEEGKAVLEHMKRFDRVRPMIDRGKYMYVNNVYDQYITVNGKAFNVMEYESRGGNFNLCEERDLAAFVDFPLNKILTTADPEYLQAHYKEMMEPFKDTLSCMFTGPFYFEFTAKGIDKAKALRTVLEPMGYKREEMVAFGDGHNDASMLDYAGYGVAMANAVEDLKAMADEVTASLDEDGIAVTVERMLEGGGYRGV